MTSVAAPAAGEQAIGPGRAMRRAAADFWQQSWRLFVLNSALSVVALSVLVASLYTAPAIVLALALGPFLAALVHACVVLAETEDLRVRDGFAGLRLHWRRGLALGTIAAVVTIIGGVSTATYADAGARAWPLAVLGLYLLVVFGVLQLLVWPLAVAHPERGLRAVYRDAVVRLLRRPVPTLGLALALLVINLAGAALALLPFLTLTIAYTFLAAAHFALSPSREA